MLQNMKSGIKPKRNNDKLSTNQELISVFLGQVVNFAKVVPMNFATKNTKKHPTGMKYLVLHTELPVLTTKDRIAGNTDISVT